MNFTVENRAGERNRWDHFELYSGQEKNISYILPVDEWTVLLQLFEAGNSRSYSKSLKHFDLSAISLFYHIHMHHLPPINVHLVIITIKIASFAERRRGVLGEFDNSWKVQRTTKPKQSHWLAGSVSAAFSCTVAYPTPGHMVNPCNIVGCYFAHFLSALFLSVTMILSTQRAILQTIAKPKPKETKASWLIKLKKKATQTMAYKTKIANRTKETAKSSQQNCWLYGQQLDILHIYIVRYHTWARANEIESAYRHKHIRKKKQQHITHYISCGCLGRNVHVFAFLCSAKTLCVFRLICSFFFLSHRHLFLLCFCFPFIWISICVLLWWRRFVRRANQITSERVKEKKSRKNKK